RRVSARSDKPILENYSLAVERGSVLAILGANGVGQTTLLHCIVRVRRASADTSARVECSRATKPILENCSLAVERGSVLAILGANGVGKTTLLNCIVGVRRPS